jgi:hypothetical protein
MQIQKDISEKLTHRCSDSTLHLANLRNCPAFVAVEEHSGEPENRLIIR